MPEASSMPTLSALVLAGGKSRRMGTDKANLCYGHGTMPQWKHMSALLGGLCSRVCVSIRSGQVLEQYSESDGEIIEDGSLSNGPLTGLLRAFEVYPDSAWLVVACDLPLLGEAVLRHLVSNRGEASSVAYTSANDGLPEPLCAIYEPSFLPILKKAWADDIFCPRKILINNPDKVKLLALPEPLALENANTPEEFERLQAQLKPISQ